MATRQQKRVSWAPESSLRQLRFFSLEDAPAKSGLRAPDQVQSRFSWPRQSNQMGFPTSRFQTPLSTYQKKKELPKFPLIMWRQPLKFILNPDWVVAEGGESEEIEVQIKRLMGVFEACYALSSTIPPDPSIAPEAKYSCCDNDQTPLIPLTAIEDEDPDGSTTLESFGSILDAPTSGSMPVVFDSNYPQEHNQRNSIRNIENPLTERAVDILHGVEPDVAAAASLVFTAILRSSDKESLVDRELLIKILSDPKVIEKLAAEYGTVNQVTLPTLSTPLPKPAMASDPTLPSSPAAPVLCQPVNPVSSSPPQEIGSTTLLHVCPQQFPTCRHSSPQSVTPSEDSEPPSSLNIYPTSRTIAGSPSKDLSYYKKLIQQHGVKDADYYKSLVQQHGGEKHDTTDIDFSSSLEFQSHALNLKPRNLVESNKQGLRPTENKSKFQRPCAFFGTPKGCKRGIHCLFLHDHLQSSSSERHGGKRIKLDKRITERI